MTAEQLMRSRYTAYCKREEKYLLETWFKETRPLSLKLENDNAIWTGLKITESYKGKAGDSTGIVTFQASFLLNNILHTMTETSHFTYLQRKWFYKDGNTKITQQQINKNSACPCGSGKKFKRCCLTKSKQDIFSLV